MSQVGASEHRYLNLVADSGLEIAPSTRIGSFDAGDFGPVFVSMERWMNIVHLQHNFL